MNDYDDDYVKIPKRVTEDKFIRILISATNELNKYTDDPDTKIVYKKCMEVLDNAKKRQNYLIQVELGNLMECPKCHEKSLYSDFYNGGGVKCAKPGCNYWFCY